MKNKSILVVALLAVLWVGCGTGTTPKIRFVTTDSNGVVNGVYILSSDGKTSTKLSYTVPQDAFWVDISPDSTKVVYCKLVDTQTGQAAIFLLDEKGNEKKLTSGGNGGDCIPAFSPDGSRITFESLRDDPNLVQIYVMNTDGSNQKRILTDAADNFFPVLSPNGNTVAFFRWNSSSATNTRPAFTKPSLSFRARWEQSRSVQHNHAATLALQPKVISTGDGLYTVNLDGSNAKQVMAIDNFAFYASSAVFTRNGGSLVFATTQFGDGSDVEIAIINLNGTGLKNLSNNSSTWDYAPMVVGDTILFDRNGPDVNNSHGPADIFRMNLDGSHQQNLTNTPNENEFLPNAFDFAG